jgi:uncharacterized membrane protein YbhN (UPF0104 family)
VDYPLDQEIETTEETPVTSGSGAAAALGYTIVAAFVVLCGYYVYSHPKDFAYLWKVSVPETAAAGFFILLSYLINVFQMNIFLRKFGLSLGYLELLALTNGAILGNLVIPMRGGTGVLAVYLKKIHGLDFDSFVAIYGGTALLVVLINAALAIIGLALLAWIHGYTHPALTAVIIALFATCLYVSVFPPPVRWKREGLLGLVFRAAHSWHLLTRDRRLLLFATFSFTAISLSLTAAFYLIYRAVGMPLSFSAVIITSGLGNLANLVPITPGSLGVFDLVVIEIPQLFGLDPPRAIGATLVFRALAFLWAFVLGIPGMVYIVRRNGKSNNNKTRSS